ncbi:MAG: SurA N-terminal domain-containing protein [Coriobacteriia bacterium]|nr:SurA N-terminal domain-containing protein [Coriobacteriia bacterium]
MPNHDDDLVAHHDTSEDETAGRAAEHSAETDAVGKVAGAGEGKSWTVARKALVGLAIAIAVVLALGFALSPVLSMVPNVAGMSVEDARAALERADLVAGEVVRTEDYDESEFATGEVVRLDRRNYTIVREGTVIGIQTAAGPPVAIVNGVTIRTGELDEQVTQLEQANPSAFSGEGGEERETQFRSLLLSGMIDQVLVEQAAEAEGIAVTDEAVEEQIDLMKSGFDSQEAFVESITGAGLSMDSLRKQIRDQLTTQRLLETLDVETSVSGKDVETFYKSNKSLFPDKKLVEVEAQVKEIILQQRRADAYQEYLSQLRLQAEIEILDPTLEGSTSPQ